MAKSKIYVGLEIGTSKTCMVVGEVKSDHTVKILGVGETPTTGVRKGEITDMQNVRICVREAHLKAEDVSNVSIDNILLAVTGKHIIGENFSGKLRLENEGRAVTYDDIDEVVERARDVAIPADHVCIMDILRQFRIDEHDNLMTPLGLMAETLEADYHIVHAIKTRIQNSIKCAREDNLNVEQVVFSPIASALIALPMQAKEAGALVIDIGGGTTDYVLYQNGGVVASGCIPVGGDHVTNDIHILCEIPLSKAEKIKCLEGDASGDPAKSVGMATIPDEKGFQEIQISRDLLNSAIHARLHEVLKLVKAKLPADALQDVGHGVYLTGGTSLMKGFGELANKVFDLEVYRLEEPQFSEIHEYYKDPRYSTALGLIRYAQYRDAEQRDTRGFLRKLWGWVWGA
ncbi:cell division protein FtsA [Rubritalea marina]|uniref:cell division protein FtsA n=1 Tax=Rubritalea marina TaxID=361055 RepID=UPI000377116E|nr:cell division protein FtsA [Rubritalea marina]